jgi:hypothetical protein
MYWETILSMVREKHNFAGRLIVLIESHAEELTRGTVQKLQDSPHTPAYRNLSYNDLYAKVFEVYNNLGRWLLEKTDGAIQTEYNDLGQRRFKEGIPLNEVIWALVLTKRHLHSYISAWALADSAVELYRRQELDRMIGQFFDRAICYTVEGYEQVRGSEPPDGAGLAPTQGETHGGWVL